MSVRFRSNAAQVKSELRGGVRANVDAAAEHFRGAVTKKLLRGTRSGARYRVPGGVSATYTASAPGEPPANRTGDLGNSFQAVSRSNNRALVGSPLVYARHLEKGTLRIEPRPYFRVTSREETPTVRKILSRKAVK